MHRSKIYQNLNTYIFHYLSCLSKLDLSKGFHQLCMDDRSKELTTFVSPFGKYQFVRMPFGLQNVLAIFQQAMEIILFECSNLSSVYIDVVLVYSDSWNDHLIQIECVLKAHRKHGMMVKPDKCSLGKKFLEYLGHKIGNGSLAIQEHRIEAMCSSKRPNTKKQLKSFIGFISYYRRFAPGLANLTFILSKVTGKSSPRVVCWIPEMDCAFQKMRECLCNNIILCVPSQRFI